MDLITLNAALELRSKINLFSEALNCFDWTSDNGIVISCHPQLIIEFDGPDGRDQVPISTELNKEVIDLLKDWFAANLKAVTDEFEKL